MPLPAAVEVGGVMVLLLIKTPALETMEDIPR
jgi:hypothetical protein